MEAIGRQVEARIENTATHIEQTDGAIAAAENRAVALEDAISRLSDDTQVLASLEKSASKTEGELQRLHGQRRELSEQAEAIANELMEANAANEQSRAVLERIAEFDDASDALALVRQRADWISGCLAKLGEIMGRISDTASSLAHPSSAADFSRRAEAARTAWAAIEMVDALVDGGDALAEPQDVLIENVIGQEQVEGASFETSDQAFQARLDALGLELDESNPVTMMGQVVEAIGGDEDSALDADMSRFERLREEQSSVPAESTTELIEADDRPPIRTRIDSAVRDLPRGELPEEDASTFKDGRWRTVVAKSDVTLYRVFGGDASKEGRFLTTELPVDRMAAKVDLALESQWGNSRDSYCEVHVPKGTVMHIGQAESQPTASGDHLPGGMDQALVDESFASDPSRYGPSRRLGFATGYQQFNERAERLEGSR